MFLRLIEYELKTYDKFQTKKLNSKYILIIYLHSPVIKLLIPIQSNYNSQLYNFIINFNYL